MRRHLSRLFEASACSPGLKVELSVAMPYATLPPVGLRVVLGPGRLPHVVRDMCCCSAYQSIATAFTLLDSLREFLAAAAICAEPSHMLRLTAC